MVIWFNEEQTKLFMSATDNRVHALAADRSVSLERTYDLDELTEFCVLEMADAGITACHMEKLQFGPPALGSTGLTSWYRHVTVFYFENSDQAFIFKLRWAPHVSTIWDDTNEENEKRYTEP